MNDNITPKRFGNIYGEDKGTGFAGNVWRDEFISPTITTMQGGDRCPMIVAMRGRNPDNPSDRTPGVKTEQRLEPNRSGVCNALTSVQKDNMVLEELKIKRVGNISSDGSQCGTVLSVDGLSGTLSAGTHGYANNHICEKVKIKQATKKGYIECTIGGVADLSYPDSKTRRGRVQDCGNTSPTLTAGESEICKIESPYRIRKLTPKECWRLMGFSDEEFMAAESVNSNTQLYKQAGNSIVVDVLEHLFKNIFETLEE